MYTSRASQYGLSPGARRQPSVTRVCYTYARDLTLAASKDKPQPQPGNDKQLKPSAKGLNSSDKR